jgi:WD40 repeat protein/serine/threonine protein kinase
MYQEFQREYLIRLPLPLAQLYQRAYNDKSPQSRHNNTFYLFEALVKLAAAPAVAAYLSEIEQGAPRDAAVDQALVHLALPSLGHWVGMLRALARHFGFRPDAAAHPLGHLWEQLNRPYRDRPGLLALYRRIKNGLDSEPSGDASCSPMQVVDALVPYRNAVFGHGAGRFESFYEQEMGPLLWPAANEMLAEGMLDLLGPRGSRLVHLAELRTLDLDRVEVGLRDLVGERSARSAPLFLSRSQAAELLPDRAAVLWPGRPVPLRVDPLLVYRERELGDEVLFLNRDRSGRQVEYLSYTRGEPERDRSTAPALAALLAKFGGLGVGREQVAAPGEQDLAETPPREAEMTQALTPAVIQGDYEVLAEIGRGGMGVVYLSRQLSLGRLVALKMLPADLAGDEVALARFRREMRLLARCDHPHIVKVLASGILPDGQLYYAMEYVPGCDLEQVWQELSGSDVQGDSSTLGSSSWANAVLSASRRKREQTTQRKSTSSGAPSSGDTVREKPEMPPPLLPLPPLPEPASFPDDRGGYVRMVVTLVRDAAMALQAIHAQNIIHRDVKPANLMLTSDCSRVVLMDFGLAKGQSLSLSASRTGGLLGTLRYAAPEQLAAASLIVGPAADVRGLGVTLWELLTRRRLFAEAADERQLAALVHDQDVPRLRAIDPHWDRDLEAIVARATERRVADRIASAGNLADLLQMYLDGRPIPIRLPSAGEIIRRWVERHKLTVGAAALTLALFAATVTASFVLVDRARVRAQNSASEEKAARKVAIIERINAEAATAREREQFRRAEAQRELAEQAARLARAREFASRAAPFLEGTRDRQTALGWALAAVRAHHPPLDEAVTALYGAVQANHIKAVLPASSLHPMRWAWRPGGHGVAAVGSRGEIVVASADGKISHTIELSSVGSVRQLDWSPDGQAFAATLSDGSTRMWDGSGKLLVLIERRSQEHPLAAWNPKLPVMLTADEADPAARLWGGDGRLLATLEHAEGGPSVAIWSSDGAHLATLTDRAADGTRPGPVLRFWNDRGGRLRKIDVGGPIEQIGWVPKRRLVWSSDGKTSIRFWASDGPVPELQEKLDCDVQDVHWSPDGKAFVTGYGAGKGWRLWGADGRALTGWMDKRTDGKSRALQIAWSPRGDRFVVTHAGDDTFARLRDPAGKLIAYLGGPRGGPADTRGQPFRIEWHGKLETGNPEHGAPLANFRWGPDGRSVATLSRVKSWIWDEMGYPLVGLGSEDEPVCPVSTFDDGLDHWNAAFPSGPQSNSHMIAFSPDGSQTAVVFSDARMVHILDRNGNAIAEFPTEQRIEDLTWSPDGAVLSVLTGESAALFEPMERPCTTLPGHIQPVSFLSWRPGAATLVTATTDPSHQYLESRLAPPEDRRLAFWNASDRVRTEPPNWAHPILSLDWNLNGRYLAILQRQDAEKELTPGILRLLDASGSPRKSLRGCDAFDWRPDGQRLAVATDQGRLMLTDPDGNVVHEGRPVPGRAADLLWDPTGKTLAELCYVGGQENVSRALGYRTPHRVDCDVHLWDANGGLIMTVERASAPIERLGWSSDGQLLSIVTATGTVELWTDRGHRHATLDCPEPQSSFCWSSDAQVLATSSASGSSDPEADAKAGTIRLWNRDGTSRAKLEGFRGAILDIVWHPKRRLLAAAGEDGTVRLLNERGRPSYLLAGHEGPVERISWNPQGTLLASLSTDGSVRLWDVDGRPVATLTGERWSRFPLATRTQIRAGGLRGGKPGRFLLAWSQDGRWLAASAAEKTARIWSTDFAQLYAEALAKLVLKDRQVQPARSQPAWEPEREPEAWLGPRTKFESPSSTQQ